MAKNTNNKKVYNFIEELSWLLDKYKEISSKELMKYFNNASQSQSEHILKTDVRTLVGILPELFQDKALFPLKEDIISFANEVLGQNLKLSSKRSRTEYIGSIVCNVSESNDSKLTDLVEALESIMGNETKMDKIREAKTLPNFSWNDAIAKLK